MSMNAPIARRPHSSRDLVSAPETTNLADLLERVLDKGVVIAGDIIISLGAVELLTLKIRLLIASIDKAREIGIDWWEFDPALSSRARDRELASRARDRELASRARDRELEGDRGLLKKRLDHLERLLLAPPQEAAPELADEAAPELADVGRRTDMAPAYVLDKTGRVIAELKQPWQQPHEDEQPSAQERVPRPAERRHEEEPPQAAQRAPQPQEEPPLTGQRASQLAERRHEEEPPQAAQRVPQPQEEPPQAAQRAPQPQEEPPQAPQPGPAQAEQPAGAGPLLSQALHERIAQAMRPVLGLAQQRNAQTRQPVEQAQPEGRQEQARPEGRQEEEQ